MLADKVRMKNMSALTILSWCSKCLRFVPLITSFVGGERNMRGKKVKPKAIGPEIWVVAEGCQTQVSLKEEKKVC